MVSTRLYESETGFINFNGQLIQISFRRFGDDNCQYEGDYKVINVKNNEEATFEEVFNGLNTIISILNTIPASVVLQSPEKCTLVDVKKEPVPHFRPRRKKLQKSGKKVSKKSGKVRKNKKSKKSRN